MGLTKYEVKDTSFPKKEGTDDFAMSAGFFKYLDKTHNFQSKAQIENYCKYWMDRHGADHPDAWKYNKFRLWAIYQWEIMNPIAKLIIPLIVAGLVTLLLYSTSKSKIFIDTHKDLEYVPAPPLDYRIEVTRKFKARTDFKEIAIIEDNRYVKYEVISGSEKLESFWNEKIPYVLKFMDNTVEVSMVFDYPIEKLIDYDELNGQLYVLKDSTYVGYYLTKNVIPGFFNKKVRFKDNYIIWMD